MAVSGPHKMVSSEHPHGPTSTRVGARSLGQQSGHGRTPSETSPSNQDHLGTRAGSASRGGGVPRVRKCLYPFLPDTLKPPLTAAGKKPQKAPHEAGGTARGCVLTESHPLRPARRPPGLQLPHHSEALPYRRSRAGGCVHKPGNSDKRPGTGERHGAAWAWAWAWRRRAGDAPGRSTGQEASGSACSGTWNISNGVWPGPSDLPVHRLPWCFSRGPTTTSVCGSWRTGKVTGHGSPEPEGRLGSVTDAAPSASANRLPSPSASTQVFNLRMPQGPSQPRPRPPTRGQGRPPSPKRVRPGFSQAPRTPCSRSRVAAVLGCPLPASPRE